MSGETPESSIGGSMLPPAVTTASASTTLPPMATLAQGSISPSSGILYDVSPDPSDESLQNPSTSIAAAVAATVPAEGSPSVSPGISDGPVFSQSSTPAFSDSKTSCQRFLHPLLGESVRRLPV